MWRNAHLAGQQSVNSSDATLVQSIPPILEHFSLKKQLAGDDVTVISGAGSTASGEDLDANAGAASPNSKVDWTFFKLNFLFNLKNNYTDQVTADSHCR